MSSASPTPGKAKPDSRLPWVTWVSPASGARGDVGHEPDAEVGLGELVGGALGGARAGEGDDDPPAVAVPAAHLLDRLAARRREALDGGGVEGDVLVVVLGVAA